MTEPHKFDGDNINQPCEHCGGDFRHSVHEQSWPLELHKYVPLETQHNQDDPTEALLRRILTNALEEFCGSGELQAERKRRFWMIANEVDWTLKTMGIPNWLSDATAPGGTGSQCVHCSEPFTDIWAHRLHERFCRGDRIAQAERRIRADNLRSQREHLSERVIEAGINWRRRANDTWTNFHEGAEELETAENELVKALDALINLQAQHGNQQ